LSVGCYSLSAYWVAVTSITYVLQCFYASLYATLVYFVSIGNPSVEQFFCLYGLILLTVLTFQAAGFFFGSVFDLANGMTAGILFITFSFAFSGFFNPQVQSWLMWLEWMNPYTYAFSLALYLLFSGNDFTCKTESSSYDVCDALSPNYKGYISDTDIFVKLNIRLSDNSGYHVLALFSFTLLFRSLSYCGLNRRMKKALLET